MLISPPPDDDEPEPLPEPYRPPYGLTAWEDKRRVELFLNVPSWKCECGLTNFGRNKQCAKWTCKKEKPNGHK